MTAQPCPNCGVLMGYEELEDLGEKEIIFYCPNCRAIWTPDEIENEYRLNAEMDRLDPLIDDWRDYPA